MEETIEYRLIQMIGRLQREDAILRWERHKEVIAELREILGMKDHQQVVFLNGAEPPHYEIRGTGLVREAADV